MPRVTIFLGQTECRLAWAWVTALLVHFVVLFLVRFELPQRPKRPHNTLEVILVHQRTATPVHHSDYLAQVQQQGGETTEKFVRPSAPLPVAVPSQTTIVSTTKPVRPLTKATLRQSTKALAPSSSTKTTPMVDSRRDTPPPTAASLVESGMEIARPSTASLVESGMEIARLSTESQPQSALRRLRSKYISANTREYKYAAYMEAWRLKVERIGNLNYPRDARRRGIYGSLILDVALNSTGDIREISVVRSSGHKLLDDAAIHIVQLSAPFSPFPQHIIEDTDILHITRTWQFREGSLSSKP